MITHKCDLPQFCDGRFPCGGVQITFDELAALKTGDRVHWVGEGDEDFGTVAENAPLPANPSGGYVGIYWDNFRVGQISPLAYRDATERIATDG